MARRPIEKKKVRRLRKLLRGGGPETFIEPEQWLQDHGYAQTRGEARKIILDGRLKSESHTVGIRKVNKVSVNSAGELYYARDPETGEYETVDDTALVPARLRSTLRVA